MIWPYILLGVGAGALALFLFLPALLARVLEPWNLRAIRRECDALGLAEVAISPYPNHYGVRFARDGVRQYAKCRVWLGRVRWLSNDPRK